MLLGICREAANLVEAGPQPETTDPLDRAKWVDTDGESRYGASEKSSLHRQWGGSFPDVLWALSVFEWKESRLHVWGHGVVRGFDWRRPGFRVCLACVR